MKDKKISIMFFIDENGSQILRADHFHKWNRCRIFFAGLQEMGEEVN